MDGPVNIISGNPGMLGGGTYTFPNKTDRQPTLADYENVFGPAGRDVKDDLQRSKRHARWHLPDALKGVNPWLTDRVDGLITDATNSPFTTIILPYKYIDQVDAKIKWNVWSFDEGLASRVPYESAARTLTQTKRAYAGYTVRQGLAITMEHNFMMSEAGRQNFQNQLKQIVGSIQYTNDIDVHVALVTAPSHAKHMAEKYYTTNKTTHQTIREYVDLFAFLAKNPNAMDIMIEEARAVLKQWGGPEPNFLLTNCRLTFQMTMLPEKTQYITQGVDGIKRLKQGPDIKSYRGLNIINSRQMSMEDGAPPRDILRRRVRVAEYHRIPWEKGVEEKSFAFYDESKDCWQRFTWHQLYEMSSITKHPSPRKWEFIVGQFLGTAAQEQWDGWTCRVLLNFANDNGYLIPEPTDLPEGFAGVLLSEVGNDALMTHVLCNINPATFPKMIAHKLSQDMAGQQRALWQAEYDKFERDPTYQPSWCHLEPVELVVVRPNIEHNMLGIIIGKGGLDDLGGTLWGQTELSVYDDSQHGIWGMSYKYNEVSAS